MRILVLRGGALCDFLVTLPALALLRRRWPSARIELAGNATAAALALRAGLLDAVHSQHEARWSSLYGVAPLPADFAAWLGSFDLVLNYWPDPDAELAPRFPVRNGQQFLSTTAVPALAPAAAHFCAPLEHLGLRPSTFLEPLRQPAPEPDLVALHPGSGSPRKNWPLDRWQALAEWLRTERRARLLIITGEAEAPGLLAGCGTTLAQRPLDEVADALARCRLFLGHDSGISHLAAAAGVPAVLLFGPTDPAMWAPPVSSVRVLRAGNELAAISLSAVRQAVRAAWPDRA